MAARRPRAGSRRMQRGVSFGGVMIVLVLIVFFATVAIRMLPSYATFWQVRSIMADLKEDPEAAAGGRSGIYRRLGNQLIVDGVRSVGRGDFDLDRVDEGYELSVDYEVRKHLFFNVDVVMHFAHTSFIEVK